MLGKNSYPPEYVKQCRSNVDELVKAYRKLATAAKGNAALAKFEPQFFNHLVLALDEYFVHRLRAVEGKDGNPLQRGAGDRRLGDAARRRAHGREVDQVEAGDVGARSRARRPHRARREELRPSSRRRTSTRSRRSSPSPLEVPGLTTLRVATESVRLLGSRLRWGGRDSRASSVTSARDEPVVRPAPRDPACRRLS